MANFLKYIFPDITQLLLDKVVVFVMGLFYIFMNLSQECGIELPKIVSGTEYVSWSGIGLNMKSFGTS